jgi:hypothetical protein
MAGFIGLLLAIATWFAGADKQVYQYAQQAGIQLPVRKASEPVASGNLPVHQDAVEVRLPINGQASTASTQATNDDPSQPAAPLPTPTGKDLPKTALFSMSYKKVEPKQLSAYQGQYIRLAQKDRRQYEGKLLSTDADGLTIERRVNGGLVEHKVSFGDIVSSEVMIRE